MYCEIVIALFINDLENRCYDVNITISCKIIENYMYFCSVGAEEEKKMRE